MIEESAFSGKKNKHTFTKLIAVTPNTGRIVAVSIIWVHKIMQVCMQLNMWISRKILFHKRSLSFFTFEAFRDTQLRTWLCLENCQRVTFLRTCGVASSICISLLLILFRGSEKSIQTIIQRVYWFHKSLVKLTEKTMPAKTKQLAVKNPHEHFSLFFLLLARHSNLFREQIIFSDKQILKSVKTTSGKTLLEGDFSKILPPPGIEPALSIASQKDSAWLFFD